MSFISRSGYEQIDGNTSQSIYNEETQELLCHIQSFKKSKNGYLVYNFLNIILLGIPYVFFKSYPKAKCQLVYSSSALSDAEYLLVRDNHNNYSIELVLAIDVDINSFNIKKPIRYFCHQHTKYIWIVENQVFCSLDQLVWDNKTCEEFAKDNSSLNEDNYNEIFALFGPNKIEVVVKSYWRLFIEEIFNPFYLFQAFSIALWCFDDYIIYAGCVVVLTLFSSITSLIQTRKQSKNLHDIVESSKCYEVSVLRTIFGNQQCLNISPEELVPGDLIVLPAANYTMPCDAVLLTGQCIVNESVLTGESVPLTKTEIPHETELYNIKRHEKHTLFSGTYILQTRYYGGANVLARVLRTGFDTTKGHLVKSILFPTPVNLQFYSDAFKFVYVLFSIALNGVAYCLYLYIQRHANVVTIIIRTLDIITIVVPPALPAAMTVGTVYSQSRLKKQKIFCISPPRINMCGKIKLACFDKTGTLTHDTLDLHSVLPCTSGQFNDLVLDVYKIRNYGLLEQGMASCHSLTRINGELTGDPLDLNMFNFTMWNLEEPGTNENTRFDMLAPTVVSPDKGDYKLGIIKEFSFSSAVQCMSVICKNLERKTFVYTKGAPEKLLGLCDPSSIPEDFESRLKLFTRNGYRVIALAYKRLPADFRWVEAQKIKRDSIECDLYLLGFIIMQNPLKVETVSVIRDLYRANIGSVMITGDHMMTAIAVARNCEIVGREDNIFIISTSQTTDTDDMPRITLENVNIGQRVDNIINIDNVETNNYFAIDGKTWIKIKCHYPELIPNIIVRTKIFARFQPDQKTQVIMELQKLDYVVAMVGDGTNDCGALKAAHVGVSLSTAEASVAAPFTSGIPNVSCITKLISEGRCSLVTSFAIFKYMAIYSLIQFFTVLILYTYHSNLGDFQFLYIDLFITTILAVTMGRQGPCRDLSSKRPLSSLISSQNLVPLILQVFSCGVVQLVALYFLFQQEWFHPIPPNSKSEIILSWENTVLFSVSSHQYVIMAWYFSKGRPYREPAITNVWFLISVIGLTSFSTWLMIAPCEKMADIMELMYHVTPKQQRFRYELLVFPLIHFLLAGCIEIFVGDRTWVKKVSQCIRRKKIPKNKYKRLLSDQNFRQVAELLQQPMESAS